MFCFIGAKMTIIMIVEIEISWYWIICTYTIASRKNWQRNGMLYCGISSCASHQASEKRRIIHPDISAAFTHAVREEDAVQSLFHEPREFGQIQSCVMDEQVGLKSKSKSIVDLAGFSQKCLTVFSRGHGSAMFCSACCTLSMMESPNVETNVFVTYLHISTLISPLLMNDRKTSLSLRRIRNRSWTVIRYFAIIPRLAHPNSRKYSQISCQDIRACQSTTNFVRPSARNCTRHSSASPGWSQTHSDPVSSWSGAEGICLWNIQIMLSRKNFLLTILHSKRFTKQRTTTQARRSWDGFIIHSNYDLCIDSAGCEQEEPQYIGSSNRKIRMWISLRLIREFIIPNLLQITITIKSPFQYSLKIFTSKAAKQHLIFYELISIFMWTRERFRSLKRWRGGSIQCDCLIFVQLGIRKFLLLNFNIAL